MKTWRIVLITVVAVTATVFMLMPRDHQPRRYSPNDYPWGVRALPGGGSEVFGLTMGKSTLADAMRRFDDSPEIGLFESRSGKLSLEAYYKEITLRGLSAKLVLNLNADPSTLQAMREHAVDRKRVQSGDNQYVLSSEDYRRARSLPITSLTYIPYIDLDEAMVEHRFGRPSERISTAKGIHHLLYPRLGLDLLLNDNGKEVLQYVAPRDFDRLRAPLKAAQRERGKKIKQPSPDN